jgi:hypothetical protein
MEISALSDLSLDDASLPEAESTTTIEVIVACDGDVVFMLGGPSTTNTMFDTGQAPSNDCKLIESSLQISRSSL